MRVMAIDYGDAHTGVAISDPTGFLAGVTTTIHSRRAEVVLYRDFAAQVAQATGLEPVLWDERRTTVDAHRILAEGGKNAKKRKKTVDAVAASLILEGYLDFQRMKNRAKEG